jgi:tRNA(Ile)-lysidine synthase
MKIQVEPGKYVIAVSGGVDSMVLLDALRQLDGIKLVVAHFDHGIRPDSEEDRKLVQRVAAQHRLPFVFTEGQLGPNTSEATARRARYEFLREVQRVSNARAVLMAHHQDDLIETAIINLLRGTNRRGLTSLKNHESLKRPLLHLTKRQIRAYALSHHLEWREDSTNADTAYLRNHIRHRIVPKLTITQRQQLTELLAGADAINQELEKHLVNYLHMQPALDVLDRLMFIRLPHNVAREVMATWLRQRGLSQFDRVTLERLVVGAKTGRQGSRIDVNQGSQLCVFSDRLALVMNER